MTKAELIQENEDLREMLSSIQEEIADVLAGDDPDSDEENDEE